MESRHVASAVATSKLSSGRSCCRRDATSVSTPFVERTTFDAVEGNCLCATAPPADLSGVEDRTIERLSAFPGKHVQFAYRPGDRIALTGFRDRLLADGKPALADTHTQWSVVASRSGARSRLEGRRERVTNSSARARCQDGRWILVRDPCCMASLHRKLQQSSTRMSSIPSFSSRARGAACPQPSGRGSRAQRPV